MNWQLLCKRTEYPKLGYIISRLTDLGIATRFEGSSWHAEHRLMVDGARIGEAWKLLGERHGRYALDDIRDDHPKFTPYLDVKPSHQEVK